MKAVKSGRIKYRSASDAIRRHYLKRTKLPQSEIARRLHVSVPLVNQIAHEAR